jgi:hypothetical protein
MMSPLEMMKLVPRAKKLVVLLQEVMMEHDSNIKKYNIPHKDLTKYTEMKQEVLAILEKDKGA